jgi:drug/metabolite transporter (DMT)-like permease
MAIHLLGEAAAVTTSTLWTGNSILFTAAGKRIGPISVNAIRIAIAVVLLSATHIILLGTVIPDANSAQWFWLGLSGIVGLGIGDFALFSAFVLIGPRKSLLLMSIAPIVSVIFSYLLLEEVLGLWVLLGIAVTLVGIVIVILERKVKGIQTYEDDRKSDSVKKRNVLGISLGVIGGVGQGLGLVFAKYGIFNAADDPSVGLDSLSATLMRMLVGAIFVWLVITFWGRLPEIRKGIKDRRGVKLTSAGAFIGPFIGVWFSMVAISYTEVGIAMTLMSLMPVMVIPVVWVLYKEKTNWRGIAGAVVAVMGVAIIFLV